MRRLSVLVLGLFVTTLLLEVTPAHHHSSGAEQRATTVACDGAPPTTVPHLHGKAPERIPHCALAAALQGGSPTATSPVLSPPLGHSDQLPVGLAEPVIFRLVGPTSPRGPPSRLPSPVPA